MADFDTDAAHATTIKRPPCAKCGMEMWLARITPDHPDHDRRTFECPGCGHEETIVVKYR